MRGNERQKGERGQMNGWIGVDLDGTLAKYDGWQGADSIGKPVTAMLQRVLCWLSQGIEVKIFTARVSSHNPSKEISQKAIDAWCLEYIGKILPVTAEKDYGMIELWDDRCVQVIPNEGIALQDYIQN